MGMTYSDARSVLSDVVDKAADHRDGSASLLEAFSALAQPRHIAEVLSSMAGDAAVIDAGAARSFRHPLGFNKITLIDALPSFMLRMHVWWPTTEVLADHIHNHRFGFATSVLVGAYDMELFQRADTGQPMTEYQEAVTDQRGWQLTKIGLAHLQLLATLRLEQGATYALPADALHRVTATAKAPCVTLFLQTARSRSTTHVFASPGQPPPMQSAKHRLTVDAYVGQCNALLAELVG